MTSGALLLLLVTLGQSPSDTSGLTPPPPPPDVSQMPPAPPAPPLEQPPAPPLTPAPDAPRAPALEQQPGVNLADAARRTTLLSQRQQLEEDRPGLGAPIALTVVGAAVVLGGLLQLASCGGVAACPSSSDSNLYAGVTITAGAVAVVVGVVLFVVRGHQRSQLDEQLQAIDAELQQLQQKMAPPPALAPPPPAAPAAAPPMAMLFTLPALRF